MLIIDGHLDLGWNALEWERDLRESVATIRTLEKSLIPQPGRGRGTVALPELRAGRVALCIATTVARSTGSPVAGLDFRSAAQAYAVAQGQLAYYRALQREGLTRIVTRAGDLDEHMAAWQAWDREQEGSRAGAPPPPLGLVLSMESADPVLAPDDLEPWYEAGVRLIGPAHYGPGRYAGGTGTEIGLTMAGRELLRQMGRLGIGLDVSHLSDQAFAEALEIFTGPVLASHSNCRALVAHQRQLTDAQMRAVIEHGGVIGSALDAWMLELGWIRGASSNAGLSLARVADHIDRVCQLAGNSRHAAIGSDLDGGFGQEQSPGDVDTIADLPKIGTILRDRGYDADDVDAIMHGNWQRFLQSVLTGL